MSFWPCQSRRSTKPYHPRRRTQTTGRGGGPRRRRISPTVALLEDRTLLTTPTITSLGISAASLTYGQMEVFTATVTTEPPGSTTPSGGTVTFMEGSTALGTAGLTAGTATFSTTALGAGTHAVTAIYSGDSTFEGSSTALTDEPIINTVAGGGTNSSTNYTGPATGAQLLDSFGVALDNSGHLFIVNDGVREVNLKTGVMTTVAGGGTDASPTFSGPATAADLSGAYGVAVDSSGNLFIADPNNNVVREVSAATGLISTIAGNGTAGYSGDGGPATAAELNQPLSVAVDKSGNLFIADTKNSVVRELDLATGVITTYAGDGNSGISGDGGPAAAAELVSPATVAVDKSGNLFIADVDADEIREVNAATGVISLIAGGGGDGYSGDGGPAINAALTTCYGIAVDSSGDLFLTFEDNHVIREINAATGVITTVVGNGNQGYSGDGGPATAAELNTPYGVAVDSSGNLFISDPDSGVIREVSTSSSGGAQTVTVSPATLTITALPETMVAGEAVPALVPSFSGFVNGDTAANLAAQPELTTTATSASPPGHYPIHVSGARSPDYNITFMGGTLTVLAQPKPATISGVSIQKIKTGKRHTAGVIVLQFSEALNFADAQNLNSYSLVTVPKKKKQKGKAVALASASYNATTFTVTLTTRKPLVSSPPIQLTVKADSLLDALGEPLDGNDSGQPGANFVAILNKSGSRVTSARSPGSGQPSLSQRG